MPPCSADRFAEETTGTAATTAAPTPVRLSLRPQTTRWKQQASVASQVNWWATDGALLDGVRAAQKRPRQEEALVDRNMGLGLGSAEPDMESIWVSAASLLYEIGASCRLRE
ncbi:hypothetical protein ACCO45_009652 [Purpureocillium lilacinum]|uniref:Uncharacterized protein n=1 Tax=Purpureocillium lilacinum TaxID=33203 RepID=A0ACC4DK99_PURLI